MQGDIKLLFRLDPLTIHFDPVMDYIHLSAQLLDGNAVNADPTLENDGLARAAGGDSRVRQEFLQALFHDNSVFCDGRPAPLESSVGLGLAQAGHAVARFPLAPSFEQLDPLESLEDISFGAGGARRAQTGMLRHISSTINVCRPM